MADNKVDITGGSPLDVMGDIQRVLIDDEPKEPVKDQPKADDKPVDDKSDGAEGRDVKVSKKDPPKEAKEPPRADNRRLQIVRAVADELKELGYLPEDFDASQVKDPDEVRDKIIENLKGLATEEAKQKLMEEYGLDDPSVIETARKLRYGISKEEINTVNIYKTIGSIEPDAFGEDREKVMYAVFKQYYIDRGLGEDEADRNAKRDLEDTDYMEIFERRRKYFLEKAEKLEKEQEERIKKEIERRKKEVEENIKKIQSLLDRGEIDGRRYSKKEIEEFKRAFFEPTEVLEIDGKKYKVTPYFKKKYERSLDIEKALRDAIDFYFGYDEERIKSNVKKKVYRSFIDKINMSTLSGDSDSIERKEI